MTDVHHIYEKKFVKKKGKYPDWIHSPLNLIEIEHFTHINEIHAPSTNEKGKQARTFLYDNLVNRLNFQYVNGDITIEEKVVCEQIYYWCLIQCNNKAFKNVELIKAYEIVCGKHKGQK